MTDYVSFSICNICNLYCPYCYKEKDGHIFEIENLIHLKKLKDLGIDVINISGGEPYCNPNIHNILEELSKTFYLYLSSNGLLIDEKELDYINQNQKIRLLSLPLYGSRKYNDSITTQNHFDKIISMIEAYKSGAYNFSLKINTIVTKNNFPDLEEFYVEHLLGKGVMWRLFELQFKGDFQQNFSSIDYASIHIDGKIIEGFAQKMNSLYRNEKIFAGTKKDLKNVLMLEPNLDIYTSHPDYVKVTNLLSENLETEFKKLQEDSHLICGKY